MKKYKSAIILRNNVHDTGNGNMYSNKNNK